MLAETTTCPCFTYLCWQCYLCYTHCHMQILCLPGDMLAGLISNGRVISLETCSRAQLPGALLNLLSQVAPMFECLFYLLQSTRGPKKRKIKEKKKHVITGNRNRKETWRTRQRPGAEFGLTPPLLSGLRRQEGCCCLVAEAFSSPGVFIKPLGLVCSPVAAAWWVAVIN